MMSSNPFRVVEGPVAVPPKKPFERVPMPFGGDWALTRPKRKKGADALYAAASQTSCLDAQRFRATARWDRGGRGSEDPAAMPAMDAPSAAAGTPAEANEPVAAMAAPVRSRGQRSASRPPLVGACTAGALVLLGALALGYLTQTRPPMSGQVAQGDASAAQPVAQPATQAAVQAAVQAATTPEPPIAASGADDQAIAWENLSEPFNEAAIKTADLPSPDPQPEETPPAAPPAAPQAAAPQPGLIGEDGHDATPPAAEPLAALQPPAGPDAKPASAVKQPTKRAGKGRSAPRPDARDKDWVAKVVRRSPAQNSNQPAQ